MWNRLKDFFRKDEYNTKSTRRAREIRAIESEFEGIECLKRGREENTENIVRKYQEIEKIIMK